jgi:hypothetical protein
MKQETHIINWILIGLISISIVLYIYYENPFINSKTIYNKTIESFVEGADGEGGEGADGEGGEGGEGADGEGGEGADGEGGVSGAGVGDGASNNMVDDNVISIRDNIKGILSLQQIDIAKNKKDGIMNNMIILTRRINDPINDVIDGYDIEAAIDNDNKQTHIETLKKVTNNPNIGEFISKIRKIGSDSGDYTLVNRDNDFYLNMTNGVKIDIKFTDNNVNNFNSEMNTDTIVNELLPTNFVGTDEDKKEYKSYKFKTCNINVIKDVGTHAIIIDYYKETNVSDVYLDILNKGIDNNDNKCKKIFATQNIIITLILKTGSLDKSINNETFKGLIEKIDIPASELSYKLGFKYVKVDGQEIISSPNGIYKVDLYIENITFKTQSMNLWLDNAINNINTEILDNQLDEIITPMFDMDNEIDKRDKIVKRVRDIYRFNKLSNSQNNMRFYNSHY